MRLQSTAASFSRVSTVTGVCTAAFWCSCLFASALVTLGLCAQRLLIRAARAPIHRPGPSIVPRTSSHQAHTRIQEMGALLAALVLHTTSATIPTFDEAKITRAAAILVLGGARPRPDAQLPFVAARCMSGRGASKKAAKKPKILTLSAGTAHVPRCTGRARLRGLRGDGLGRGDHQRR